MLYKIFVLVVTLLVLVSVEAELRHKHPDVGLNVKQLIRKYKYPFEKHTTTTEDGYILEIHRIPYGRNVQRIDNRPVAFLMPGVLCSSADWVNMGPERSLGFILADKGYDVWLGNYRGTTWSRKHVTLSPSLNKSEFWDFSFQQIGYYDAPAIIDYILNATQQENLFYIGHSQGTTSFFAMASTRPEYNDKIRLMSALSPVIYMDNVKTPIVPIAAKYIDQVEAFVEKHEYYEVMRHTLMITLLGQTFCNDDSPTQDLCALLFYFIAGFSPGNFNKTMIPVITSNTPAGSSIQQFLHYTQEHKAGKFQHYDYGEAENLVRYGQNTPPEYDLQKVTAPLALYYGDRDLINSEIDVERAAAELPNVVELKLIKGYNHLDHMWAINVESTLYKGLIELMDLH